MTEFTSSIYQGWVMHKRLQPMRLHFSYRVFMFFLDLAELSKLDQGKFLFGYNRRAVFSFYDRDHGARDGSNLTAWVKNALAQARLDIHDLTIRILCFPRVLGYVFNPLSIFFCYDGDNKLHAVLYEVKNTFGEQHTYLFPVKDPGAAILRQYCAKNFYVSPFLPLQSDYAFRLAPPGATFALGIRQIIATGDQLVATWTGRRQSWSETGLLRCFRSYALLTFKVIGAIHWQALRLWLKGAKFHQRPAPPAEDVSIHDTK